MYLSAEWALELRGVPASQVPFMYYAVFWAAWVAAVLWFVAFDAAVAASASAWCLLALKLAPTSFGVVEVVVSLT